MTQILIFLAIFNLVGFTVMPYLCSRLGSLAWSIPLPGLYKIFVAINLYFLGMVVMANPTMIAFFLFPAVAFLNLIFDFRYATEKLINFKVPIVFFGNLIRDLKTLKAYKFDGSCEVDWDIFFTEENRIMMDVVLFVCNVMAIAMLI